MRSRCVDLKRRPWRYLSLFLRLKKSREKLVSIDAESRVFSPKRDRDSPSLSLGENESEVKNRARDDVVNRARRNEIHFPTWINHQIINGNPVVSYCDRLWAVGLPLLGTGKKEKAVLKENEDIRIPARKTHFSSIVASEKKKKKYRKSKQDFSLSCFFPRTCIPGYASAVYDDVSLRQQFARERRCRAKAEERSHAYLRQRFK